MHLPRVHGVAEAFLVRHRRGMLSQGHDHRLYGNVRAAAPAWSRSCRVNAAPTDGICPLRLKVVLVSIGRMLLALGALAVILAANWQSPSSSSCRARTQELGESSSWSAAPPTEG